MLFRSAAQHSLPAGLVAALDVHLRAHAAVDRIDEVLEELQRIREEAGSPPLASPIGQILASQALIHVLSAQRYQTVVDELRGLLTGRFGSPPAGIDENVLRAVQLVTGDETPSEAEIDLENVREQAAGLAASDEELLLLALFGKAAEPLLHSIRGRGRHEDAETAVEPARAERIRELVRIVQESGVGEVTIEDAGMRVTVRRSEERPTTTPSGAPEMAEPAAPAPAVSTVMRVEAPMVGTFYRAPEPGAAPYVEVGDIVVAGQTLCILEAMKLMNEIKAEAEGQVKSILAENAQAVEYGQVLFELEPVDGRPPIL